VLCTRRNEGLRETAGDADSFLAYNPPAKGPEGGAG
jgi:hypothetical protein